MIEMNLEHLGVFNGCLKRFLCFCCFAKLMIPSRKHEIYEIAWGIHKKGMSGCNSKNSTNSKNSKNPKMVTP